MSLMLMLICLIVMGCDVTWCDAALSDNDGNGQKQLLRLQLLIHAAIVASSWQCLIVDVSVKLSNQISALLFVPVGMSSRHSWFMVGCIPGNEYLFPLLRLESKNYTGLMIAACHSLALEQQFAYYYNLRRRCVILCACRGVTMLVGLYSILMSWL